MPCRALPARNRRSSPLTGPPTPEKGKTKPKLGRLRRLYRTDCAGLSESRTCRAVRPEREAAPHRPMNRPPDPGIARPRRSRAPWAGMLPSRGSQSRRAPADLGWSDGETPSPGTSPAECLPCLGYPMMGREELAGGPAAVLSWLMARTEGRLRWTGASETSRIGSDRTSSVRRGSPDTRRVAARLVGRGSPDPALGPTEGLPIQQDATNEVAAFLPVGRGSRAPEGSPPPA